MTSPNLTFITDQAQILKCLIESFHRGNVVGITSEATGHTTFLTVVENIYESGSSKEKVIVFNKFDIHGSIHDKNCILLKQIDRVQSFQTLYKDSLRKTFRAIVSQNESNIKVRQLESSISSHDLKILLSKMLDSPQRISIRLSTNKIDTLDGFVKDLDARFEKVVIASGPHAQAKKEIKLAHIETIEFENYFSFKGSSSKIFQVQESSLKLSKAQ